MEPMELSLITSSFITVMAIWSPLIMACVSGMRNVWLAPSPMG